MFWKNWNWPTRILAVFGLAVVAAILFPVFARSPGGSHGPSCMSNLKQIGLGIVQYTQDYDEKFPPVESSVAAYGWADTIYPYIKSTQLYQCPKEADPGQSDPRKSGYTDYPFNKRFIGQSMEKVKAPASQILCLDGRAEEDAEATDARYSFTQIPLGWRQNQESPLYRHLGMASYLFADGHVKSLYPSQVENAERTRAVF